MSAKRAKQRTQNPKKTAKKEISIQSSGNKAKNKQKIPKKAPGARMLKIASGLLMFAGALSGVMAYYTMKQFREITPETMDTITALYGQNPQAVLLLTIGTSFVGIFQFLFGYVGYKQADNPFDAKKLMIYGGILFVLELGVQLFGAASSSMSNLSTIIAGLILPVFYIIGAYRNSRV